MKTKVLHIIGGMNRCGAETFLMNVYREIDKDRFDFYFLCYDKNVKYDYEDEINTLGGKIISIPSLKKVGVKKFISSLQETMKDNKFDVIHAHTYYNSALPLYVARRSKIPIRIVHSHTTLSEYKSSLIKKAYNFLSKIIIDKNANMFLACSEDAGKSLFFRNRKIIIIKNGINLNQFKFSEKARKKIREKFKIKQNEVLIGHIGRFEEEKNHIFLIQIFKCLLQKNKNYKLMLLGNGKELNNIKKLCKENQLQNKILFLGNVSNVSEIINAFDLFVFPSLFEGLGIVLIEAQANGLKCITSNKVPKEADISGKTQFLSLEDGCESWVNSILNTNIEREKINTIHFNYDIKDTVNILVEIYNQLL